MEIDQSYPIAAPRAIELDWPKVTAYFARVISRLGSPPVSAIAGIAIMANVIGVTGWLWALLYLAFAVPAPTLYVVWKMRRGEITDFHIQVREQRTKPYLVILLYTGLALIGMVVGRAPQLMILVAAAGWLQTATLFVITLWWKISAHAAAAAGISVLALGTLGLSAWPLALSVPLVAWSRVKLQRHTLSQTLVGSALGLLISIGALYLYRQG
jgi:membrane-associated phospholipid phosphatase